MSKFDLTLQETTWLTVNKMHTTLPQNNDDFLNQEALDNVDKMDIDLQDWLEIFEEDQVKLEGCR